jgi:hypothetical protein
MPRRRSQGLPRARLALPPLSGAQALEIVNVLDRAIAAIWRAHGDAMADCLADLYPRRRPHRATDVPPASTSEADDDSAAPTTAVAQALLPF